MSAKTAADDTSTRMARVTILMGDADRIVQGGRLRQVPERGRESGAQTFRGRGSDSRRLWLQCRLRSARTKDQVAEDRTGRGHRRQGIQGRAANTARHGSTEP